MGAKRLTVNIVLVLFMFTSMTFSQSDKKISGWSFGGVPALAYNSDTGFLYGVIVNTYNYGDGTIYPDYLFSIYTEWSRTTKGSGINKIFFDSEYLLPKDIRITGELSYLTEQALPFYGFNGYEADFDPVFEISDEQHEDFVDSLYISRVYYRHERNIMKLTADFQRRILVENLRWIAGFGFWSTEVGPVDINTLNKGKDEADKLPDTTGLYDEYIDNDIIAADEADGGKTNYIKLGLVYDTRDNEPNPMSGIWTEALITTVPEFLGSDFSYTTLTATHRQYFTLIPQDLSFTYRLGYQSTIGGNIPFFMLPFYQSSYKTEEGLGGSKSLRGVLKNRVVGSAISFGNLELRWKFYRAVVVGQNLYLALNAFVDAGKVLKRYEVNVVEEAKDRLHLSYGGGLRIALNENFIVAVDYGMAADEQDGTSGLYIGLGYLY